MCTYHGALQFLKGFHPHNLHTDSDRKNMRVRVKHACKGESHICDFIRNAMRLAEFG